MQCGARNLWPVEECNFLPASKGCIFRSTSEGIQFYWGRFYELIFQAKILKCFTRTYRSIQYDTNSMRLACSSVSLEVAQELQY